MVNNVSNKYLDAELHFERVELEWMANFPLISLKINDGTIVSHALRPGTQTAAADSLVSFNEVLVSVNLPELILGKINIRRIRVTAPKIYGYISPSGKANWDILKPTQDQDTMRDQTPLSINIDSFSILKGAQIVYHSEPDSLHASINIRRFYANGKLTNDLQKARLARLRVADMELVVRKSDISFESHIDTLGINGLSRHRYQIDMASTNNFNDYRDLQLGLTGAICVDSTGVSNRILFNDLHISPMGLKVTLDGGVQIANDSLRSDLTCKIDSIDFESFKQFIPQKFLPNRLHTTLSADIRALIQGSSRFDGSLLPLIEMDFSVPGGSLSYDSISAQMDNLAMSGTLRFDPTQADSTGIKFRLEELRGAGLQFSGSGSVWNALKDPRIDCALLGKIDLEQISTTFLKRGQLRARGILEVDISGNSRLSHLSLENLDRVDFRGRATCTGLEINVPKDSINLLLGASTFSFGSNASTRDSLIPRGTRIVRMSLRTDTLALRYYDTLTLDVSKLRLSARTGAKFYADGKRLEHPMSGNFDASSIFLSGFDATTIRMRGASSIFTIIPALDKQSSPKLRLQIESQRSYYRNLTGRYSLRDSEINIQASLSALDQTRIERRERRMDSLQLIYPQVMRDSLIQFSNLMSRMLRPQDRFTESDLDLKVEGQMAALFRQWDLRGDISAASGRVVTPYFPLIMQLSNLKMDFNNSEVKLHHSEIRLGESDVEIDCRISNLRRALLSNGAIKINANIKSDTLNVNELVRAANAGSNYGAPGHTAIDQLNDEDLEQQIMLQTSDQVDQSDLIIIPRNLDLELGLKVKYGLYGNIELDNLTGKLITKDRRLQLENLQTNSSAGSMALTAIYTTINTNEITTGFDLEMKQMEVAKFIDMIPAVDQMLPMLASLEGFVDCQIAATARLDTAMNIMLPTLKAACRLNGKDMVLLDGKTFSEISKMLKFKNRKRNLIDRISVEMVVTDNQMTMFPFIMEMDRYKAAISGIHNLDMSFNYHISVLKSPIPFRLGIDIVGTLDDYRFRIGKARYKSENLPSYVEMIDTTRVNLRSAITDVFQRGVDAARLGRISVAPIEAVDSVARDQFEALTPADSLLIFSTPTI